ncbi:MAG: hypothetical protein ACR2I0_12790, partial [Rhodoferax sp.]
MSSSFFRSESGRFASAAVATLLLAALLQLWLAQGDWTGLLALLPCALVLLFWVRRLVPHARLLGAVQALMREVAHGHLGQRMTDIQPGTELHAVCWQMNDMLDQLEACFREQATALSYAADAKYFRFGQSTGLRGAFQLSLLAMNESLKNMEEKVRQEQGVAQEKALAQEREQRIASENLRIRNALDKCSTNVMIANADLEIIYMNETVAAMMSRNEAELRKVLPGFEARKL